MHNILKRFSKLHLAIMISLALSALFALIGFSSQLSSNAAPFAGGVIEETLADGSKPMPTPVKPTEQENGWTAWSG